MDISVNRTFKESIKREYVLSKINNKNLDEDNNKSKLTRIREELITIINHIWWETNDITSTSIINGFKKAGINLKDDGSEDDNYAFPVTNISESNYSLYDSFEKKIINKNRRNKDFDI